MGLIKVSAVSYANTLPFVFGLTHSPVAELIDLSLDIPAVCADKLMLGEVELGLIPVVETLNFSHPQIVSDYCIGANGKVRTVALLSDVPLNRIKRIFLDFQSRTSVQLVRILAEKYWEVNPEFLSAEPGFEEKISDTTAAVIIGDRVFAREKKHKYVYDLAYEWKQFTGLPFVFAAWVSLTKPDRHFLKSFNSALQYGLNHLDEVTASATRNEFTQQVDLHTYFKENIDFYLDEEKKASMQYFLSMVKKNVPV
ncbi:MAG: menaquinone biosynthetic enzyme MqnA/MqnD family protein [Bacteroidota bacterium]